MLMCVLEMLRGADGVQDAAVWSSEDDLFNQYEAQSMASVQSERPLENIIQRRSRVSSQENGTNAVIALFELSSCCCCCL